MHPESALHFPLADTLPATGQMVEVSPGLGWVRLPLPFALDHIHLWLLADTIDGESCWTLVDTGISSDASRAAWELLFVGPTRGLPIRRVICTHMHPDHLGLADWITQRFTTARRDCRLWMSATDMATARTLVHRTAGTGGERAAAHFARHGVSDEAALAKVRERGNYYASMVPSLPEQFRRLMHDMVVPVGGEDWRCLVGHGHAPEHMMLFNEQRKVLISGDMVLPRISTNVSVFDEQPEDNPLALYLASLERLLALPADTLVLPSHGRPFVGLHTRIQQLKDHHTARLAEAHQACVGQAMSAADMVPVLFPRALDTHQLSFALGEALAHLHWLWYAGRVHRRNESGVWRFRAA